MLLSGYNTDMNFIITAIRRSAASIALLATLFALVGCGVEGERLIALTSFKQIETEPRGSVFMEMVRAYYDQASDTGMIDQAYSVSFKNKLERGEVRDEERTALLALLSIQGIDESQPVPSEVILQRMSDSEIWNMLSIRSRRSFLRVYH